METLDLLFLISCLATLLFINEHYTSKALRENLDSERFARSVLESITEDMLEKIEELYFEIYEFKRKEKNIHLRSVGAEDRRSDL